MSVVLKRTATVLAVAGFAATFGGTAMAGALPLIFWTNFGGEQLVQGDPNAATNTVIDTIAQPSAAGDTGNPDSLIFDTNGNIVYTMYNGDPHGELRSFNPNTNTDTLISNAFGGQLVDLALDPGGTTVLVADRSANQIDRVNLSTGVSTLLATVSEPDGIAYDNAGHLFVNSGGTVVQLDPTTGALLNTSASDFGFLDGLTYDPVSNLLYAALGGCMETFDTATLTAGSCVGSFSDIDGLESDGQGNIFVADVGADQVGLYNIAGDTSMEILSAPGLDDIAPLAGLGAPPPTGTPEPASAALLGAGLLGLRLLRRRKP